MSMNDCIIPNRKTTTHGYVMGRLDGRYQGMHRIAWQILNGTIPNGMMIDHTCHNDSDCNDGESCKHRACVNPSHLRMVTHLENVRAGKRSLAKQSHCKNGHEVNEDTLGVRPSGMRYCKPCRLEHNKRSVMKSRAVN